MITEMIVDRDPISLEPTVKTVCDGKRHRNYSLIMKIWQITDEFDCICYFPNKSSELLEGGGKS